MIFIVARDIQVEPQQTGTEGQPVTIGAGEQVRLLPEFASSPIAHVVWRERVFSCNKAVFLASTSPIGRAPD